MHLSVFSCQVCMCNGFPWPPVNWRTLEFSLVEATETFTQGLSIGLFTRRSSFPSFYYLQFVYLTDFIMYSNYVCTLSWTPQFSLKFIKADNLDYIWDINTSAGHEPQQYIVLYTHAVCKLKLNTLFLNSSIWAEIKSLHSWIIIFIPKSFLYCYQAYCSYQI